MGSHVQSVALGAHAGVVGEVCDQMRAASKRVVDESSDNLRAAVLRGEPWSRICGSHLKLRVKTLGTSYSSEIFLLSRFDPIISIRGPT